MIRHDFLGTPNKMPATLIKRLEQARYTYLKANPSATVDSIAFNYLSREILGLVSRESSEFASSNLHQ